MESKRQLSILEANKTKVFYSPFAGKKDVLVRTGTCREKYPILHALLHASSKSYVKNNNSEREEIVLKLYSEISEKINRKKWEEDTDTLLTSPFQEKFHDVIVNFYDYFTKKKPCKFKFIQDYKKHKETFEIICQLYPLENFEKIQKELKNLNNASFKKEILQKVIQDFTQEYDDKIGRKMKDDKRKEHCVNKFTSFIETAIKLVDRKIFSKYQKGLQNYALSVDKYSMKVLSEKFGRNIYIMNHKRVPFIIGDRTKEKKSVILLWMGGVQYEVIGRLLPKDHIQREFTENDPIVKRINAFLFNSDTVHLKYPKLIPYLPKEKKEDLGMFSSKDSSSFSDSD